MQNLFIRSPLERDIFSAYDLMAQGLDGMNSRLVHILIREEAHSEGYFSEI